MGRGVPLGVGFVVGGHELLYPVGTGGMAQVWAARRCSGQLDMLVALKIILPELRGDTDYERMFLDEANLAARIAHPNVAQIFDFGDQDGLLYQVMEWVDGEPLSVLGCATLLAWPVSACIVAQACMGLHAAHEVRSPDGAPVHLVHRDVSPQNLLVGYDGIVKVIDFGIAKAVSNSARTRFDHIKGKVSYMAPEQIRREPIDRRTDVFALGVVLYRLLTGRHPFRGADDWSTLQRIASRCPALPPRRLLPQLPSSLSDIVMSAIAKDPDRRFATMAELARALDAAIPSAHRASPDHVARVMRHALGEQRSSRRSAIERVVRSSDVTAGLATRSGLRRLVSDPAAAARRG